MHVTSGDPPDVWQRKLMIAKAYSRLWRSVHGINSCARTLFRSGNPHGTLCVGYVHQQVQHYMHIHVYPIDFFISSWELFNPLFRLASTNLYCWQLCWRIRRCWTVKANRPTIDWSFQMPADVRVVIVWSDQLSLAEFCVLSIACSYVLLCAGGPVKFSSCK